MGSSSEGGALREEFASSTTVVSLHDSENILWSISLLGAVARGADSWRMWFSNRCCSFSAQPRLVPVCIHDATEEKNSCDFTSSLPPHVFIFAPPCVLFCPVQIQVHLNDLRARSVKSMVLPLTPPYRKIRNPDRERRNSGCLFLLVAVPKACWGSLVYRPGSLQRPTLHHPTHACSMVSGRCAAVAWIGGTASSFVCYVNRET